MFQHPSDVFFGVKSASTKNLLQNEASNETSKNARGLLIVLMVQKSPTTNENMYKTFGKAL